MSGMSISDQSAFPAIASELLQTVERAFLELRAMPDAEAGRPRAPGKWSPKQVIGHLVDSAANNHQRFVRAQEAAALQLPGTSRTIGSDVSGMKIVRGARLSPYGTAIIAIWRTSSGTSRKRSDPRRAASARTLR